MKRLRLAGQKLAIIAASAFLLATAATVAQAQHPKHHLVVPKSSVITPGTPGTTAHTNLLVMMAEGGPVSINVEPQTPGLPPVLGLFFETPASLACVYRLVRHPVPGCNPDQTTVTTTGGSGAIAIVDSYDDPNAASDLAVFSSIFNLPPPDLTVVYASGTEPPLDPTGGWELEESLDIEYAHAMAPGARIFLVEAASNSGTDIFTAIQVASNLVAANGGGEVSMSFDFGGEFAQETQLDAFFTTPGVVYLSAAGDFPGPEYPASSPNVIAAGGTTISRNPNTGYFLLENTWQDTGGGSSAYEPRPHFQDRIEGIVGQTRGTPDLSFDANPNTGVWVVDTNLFQGQPGGFFIVGGTSLSTPGLAGIINNAGKFARSSQAENSIIYRGFFSGDNFRDIVYGNCGFNIGSFATPGWDFCTGVGSNQGLNGK